MWILSVVGLGVLLNIQVICNAFDCQFSVCTFNVNIPKILYHMHAHQN